ADDWVKVEDDRIKLSGNIRRESISDKDACRDKYCEIGGQLERAGFVQSGLCRLHECLPFCKGTNEARNARGKRAHVYITVRSHDQCILSARFEIDWRG